MATGAWPAPRGVQHGLGLIELLVALAITAVLAGLAYPGYQSVVQRARRSDALAWFAQLQMAQARHRSNHPSYATLAQLGLPVRSPGGHYALSEEPPTTNGYRVMATAQGGQALDERCRHLLLQVDGLDTRQASGSSAEVDNPQAPNQRCWGN